MNFHSPQKLVRLSLLFVAAGCTPGPSTDAGVEVDAGDPSTFGDCHTATWTAPVCASAPARLGTSPLGLSFFQDVFAATQLTGKLGRRVTFGDVDGDKFPDFIAVETGVKPGLQHLYLNRPDPSGFGRVFNENTADSGILLSRTGGVQTALMVTFADIDNDGDLDLYEGSYSQKPNGVQYVADPDELYLNDGSGHFTLLASSGLNRPWPLTTVAAAFLDYDRDGKLDVYIGNFMINYQFDYWTSYQDELFHGAGDGTFTNVTGPAGLTTSAPIASTSGLYSKPTYGATACDWNNDGFADILTSTYGLGWNDLWKNKGDSTFAYVGPQMNFNMDSSPYADTSANGEPNSYRWGGNTFSASCGDYDNDGDLDVFNAETTHGDIPRNSADRSRILVNSGADGGYVFLRPSLAETGINRPLGPNDDEGDHGADWLDFDNDGLLDLVIEQSAYPGAHASLFHQKPDHTFEDVTQASGVLAAMINSNGLSVDDYDRDGDLDILMGSVNAGSQPPPTGVEQVHLFENIIGRQGNSLYVTLEGVSANRQGIGARVSVTAGCLTQLREINGGKGTFGATNPAYAHFGLGTAEKIDKLEVTWPTNPPTTQTFYNLEPNKFLHIKQGSTALTCVGRQ